MSLKHLVSIADLSTDQMEHLWNSAQGFRDLHRGPKKYSSHLHGKSVFLGFFEKSTRTQISFECAAKRLGAEVIHFNPGHSSLSKNESLEDTFEVLDAYHPDVFVIRHPEKGIFEKISTYTSASLINAGDGEGEHPTQALIDLMTMKEHFGELNNLPVCIVGDVRRSRVAKSNILALQKCGAKVGIFAPEYFKFNTIMNTSEIDLSNIENIKNKNEALQFARAFIFLRVQKERSEIAEFNQEEYINSYQFEFKDFENLQSIILHPGPVNWGIELHENLKKSKHLAIIKQVENGLALRSALLYSILQNG